MSDRWVDLALGGTSYRALKRKDWSFVGQFRDAEPGETDLAAGCVLLLLAEGTAPECRLRMGLRLLLDTSVTVGPLIERLTAEGLVAETARDWRHHAITASGRATLDDWVRSVRGLVGTLDAALSSQGPSAEPKQVHAGRRRAR